MIFRPENVNEICFVLGHNGRLLLADPTFCCSFTSFPSEPAVTLWGHLSARPKPAHTTLLRSAGSESCRQAVQVWARLQNWGNIFRQNMLQSIWKDLIRKFNTIPPQFYILIYQCLNFVTVLVSQSLNSCDQVILKLEPRAPFQLHKWQPFQEECEGRKMLFHCALCWDRNRSDFSVKWQVKSKIVLQHFQPDFKPPQWWNRAICVTCTAAPGGISSFCLFGY